MLELNVESSVSKAIFGGFGRTGSVVIAPVITEAGMCELRHFSTNWIWVTMLPCVLGVKAFGPVVQYCLEC